MSARLVGRITPSGVIETLWYPEFEDGTLDVWSWGPVHRERASHVEPVPDGPGWQVTLADGTDLGWFPTRAGALAAEVRLLEERLLAGEPLLVKG